MHKNIRCLPYVIFARMMSGMNAVDAIAESPTRLGGDGDLSAPVTPLRIKKVTIRS